MSTRGARSLLAAILGAVTLPVLIPAAAAESGDTGDLEQMSLEQLTCNRSGCARWVRWPVASTS
jgi:hypothetical protein